MSQRKAYYNHILQEKPIYKDVLDCLKEEDKESLYNLVFLPVLIEFISWVLTETQRSGKRRLYFLARDGYQMYLVAQKLCMIQKIPIECRYLKVSRYSMRIPEYHLLKEKCVDYICTGGIDVTVERIMKRAGLDESMANNFLTLNSSKRLLNYKEIMTLKEELRGNQAFLNQVAKVSKEAYKPALQYLRQEGLFDGTSFALVDSGWIGTLQKTIAHLIDKPDLEGYYFGLYEIPKGANKDKYHAFYFSPHTGLHRKVNFSNCLFEAIFTSPEGMTIGYEWKDHKCFPVSDFVKNPNEKQIMANCSSLENYMEAYKTLIHNHEISQKGNHKSQRESRRFVKKLLDKAMGTPTSWEVSCFGDLLFSDDVLEGNLKKVAADLSTEEIQGQRFMNKALIMLGLKKEELHESAWIEGSILRNSVQVKQNLLHAKLYKFFVYIRKMLK